LSMKQFVTFRIGSDLFGIDVRSVREINRVLDATPVPHAPEYVRGLVNLRGQTVTVFDLGVRLGLPRREITGESHNVVLKGDLVGLLVDAIGDVLQCDESEIEPLPANTSSGEGKFIEAVVKLRDELLVVLSAARILERGC